MDYRHGRHLLQHIGHLLYRHAFYNLDLGLWFHLFQYVGCHLFIEGKEYRLSGAVVQVFDDIGQI